MSRRAAILGLGRRGEAWAALCLQAGWDVRSFDPAVNTASAINRLPGIIPAGTISGAVRDADCVICTVPDRLELIQMVLKRAQAEMPSEAVIGVASVGHDIEAIQACSFRPGQIVRLVEPEALGVALEVTDRNPPEARQRAERLAAELAAVLSFAPPPADHQGWDAESA
jgi:3-hydroxyacyl-CoA dehydrogenase